MKYLLAISTVLTIIITSCSSVPEGFCECLAVGEKLNAKTQVVLAGEATDEMKIEMIQLRKEKIKLCEKFAANAGPQMLEWQEECSN